MQINKYWVGFLAINRNTWKNLFENKLAWAHLRNITDILFTLKSFMYNQDLSLNDNQRLIYVVPSISFQTFFVQAPKIVVDTWKFRVLLLYILWDDRLIFMISGLNEQLQPELEDTLLNPDCLSWWIWKMQSGREDTLQERYAIKFCLDSEEMPQKRMECFRLLFRPSCMNRASVFEWHKRFKEGREPVRDDERYWRSKEVNTPELIGQTVWVRVTTLRF